MFSTVFNDKNLFSGDQTTDLECVLGQVFFPVEELDSRKRDRSQFHGDHLLVHTVYSAAYAYYEYIDDSLKPQWHHILQMLSDLRGLSNFGHPSKKFLSHLGGMKPGGTVSDSMYKSCS